MGESGPHTHRAEVGSTGRPGLHGSIEAAHPQDQHDERQHCDTKEPPEETPQARGIRQVVQEHSEQDAVRKEKEGNQGVGECKEVGQPEVLSFVGEVVGSFVVPKIRVGLRVIRFGLRLESRPGLGLGLGSFLVNARISVQVTARFRV